jgi:hypothetical protein
MRPVVLPLALLFGSCACARSEPPGAAKPPAVVASDAALPGQGAAPNVATAPDLAASADAATSIDASASADAATSIDAGALPQTRDRPATGGGAFDARVAALWDGIVADDPARAMSFFFPVAAYEQVKAIANPSRDWKLRLVAAYARDIHELHKKVGAGARFVRFEEGPGARWVEPGEEYNKLGYFRVFGSKIHFERDGRADSLVVKSLISWRGEWYVVHLSAIK